MKYFLQFLMISFILFACSKENKDASDNQRIVEQVKLPNTPDYKEKWYGEYHFKVEHWTIGEIGNHSSFYEIDGRIEKFTGIGNNTLFVDSSIGIYYHKDTTFKIYENCEGIDFSSEKFMHPQVNASGIISFKELSDCFGMVVGSSEYFNGKIDEDSVVISWGNYDASFSAGNVLTGWKK